MIRNMRNNLLSLTVLLSILTAALGTLWIGTAEAKLGIEICTAQGIKHIDARTGAAIDQQNQEQQEKHEALAPCFICHHNQKHCALLSNAPSIDAVSIHDAAPQLKSKQFKAHPRNIATNTINSRAPPAISIL